MTFKQRVKPLLIFRGVAQSGSARALGAWGRGFKSLHPDHNGELSEWFMEPVLKTGMRKST